MAELNRLQAVFPRAQDVIGIAGGFPLRLKSTTTSLQGLPRGPRAPMSIVNKLNPDAENVRLIGGIPGRNGMMAILDPMSLVTNAVDIIGNDCLTGFAALDDVQLVVNAKGLLFHRKSGETWINQPAHQGACTGILVVDSRTFVTIGLDGLLHIWDHQCRKLGTLEGHTGGITDATISPDGSVITTGTDRSVRIWDPVRQRQKMFLKGFENPLVRVHTTKAGTLVVDTTGQVFLITEIGKPAKVGSAAGYPCASWVLTNDSTAIFIALRTGTIHRFPIG